MITYTQVPSPNFGYPRGKRGQNRPRAVIWHITASAPTSPPLAGLDSWFTNPVAGSAHIGIQDGEKHQYVQFDDAAWHAGYLNDPDLTNPHVYRWWNGQINPNVESIGVEVISLPGPDDVARRQHRLNDETWASMIDVGLDITERYPTIDLVAFDWLGHWQNDGVNRIRDPQTVYWPIDIMVEILEKEERDMTTYKLLRQWNPAYTWLIAYLEGVPIYKRHLAFPETVTHLAKTLGEPETIDKAQLATIPTL